MVDWCAIKTEYITTKTSYRKLAEKYGVNKDTIWQKGKDERWEELRRQHQDDIQTKILASDTEQKVSRAEKLNEAAGMLLGIAVAQMEARNPLEMDTQSMKHLSGVLKDIKDILMIKSDADMREQNARIEKLQAEANKDDKSSTGVSVTLEGVVSEYGE